MKSKTCPQHQICSSSDSQLAICKCWCAECKEIMEEARKAFKLSGAARITVLSRAAKGAI
jgi:hypothetical protein